MISADQSVASCRVAEVCLSNLYYYCPITIWLMKGIVSKNYIYSSFLRQQSQGASHIKDINEYTS